MSDSTNSPDLNADFRAMLRDLDNLSYEMLEHPRSNDLCELIERLQRWGCRASKHNWIFDQCGYWQHQYCVECGSAKYPDMARRSCGELTAEMGKMAESDYGAGKPTPVKAQP